MNTSAQRKAVLRLALKLSLAVVQVIGIVGTWGMFPGWFVGFLSLVACGIVYLAIRDYHRDLSRGA